MLVIADRTEMKILAFLGKAGARGRTSSEIWDFVASLKKPPRLETVLDDLLPLRDDTRDAYILPAKTKIWSRSRSFLPTLEDLAFVLVGAAFFLFVIY